MQPATGEFKQGSADVHHGTYHATYLHALTVKGRQSRTLEDKFRFMSKDQKNFSLKGDKKWPLLLRAFQQYIYIWEIEGR